ncbi:MAG: SprT-like domain-containing protein [Deinococcus sp.]|nr:SprT-like domain-containing protein [Deinococcus sp.]
MARQTIGYSPGQLQRLFAEYNAAYFGGIIPPYGVEYGSRRMTSRAGICYPGLQIIRLSPVLLGGDRRRVRDTLLHEMTHAWLAALRRPWGHTDEFKAKLLELRDLGAHSPVGNKELVYHCYRRAPRRRPYFLFRCRRCGARAISAVKRRYSCGRCQPQRFDPRFQMVFAGLVNRNGAPYQRR